MKSVQINLSLVIDGESASSLVELLASAVERGTASSRSSIRAPLKAVEIAQEPKTKMTTMEASQNANLRGQKPPEDKGLLIDTRQAVKLLGLSSRKIWQMANSGEMPKTIKIGRLVRWSYEELQAWAKAGCPPQDKWKWPK